MSSWAWLSGRCLVLYLGCLLALGLSTLGATQVSAAPLVNGKIAFWSDRDGNAEIYSMSSDGSGQANLTNSAGGDRNPDWSSDGTKIAFRDRSRRQQ